MKKCSFSVSSLNAVCSRVFQNAYHNIAVGVEQPMGFRVSRGVQSGNVCNIFQCQVQDADCVGPAAARPQGVERRVRFITDALDPIPRETSNTGSGLAAMYCMYYAVQTTFASVVSSLHLPLALDGWTMGPDLLWMDGLWALNGLNPSLSLASFGTLECHANIFARKKEIVH